MSGRLALVRAKHLIHYISVLRGTGAPVDRSLARSQLPSSIEETPELYVQVPAALEWIARAGQDFEPMELGLLGAREASLGSLGPTQQTAIITAQTGLQRIEALARISGEEDSALEMSIQFEGAEVRIICDMVGLRGHLFLCFAEWLNLKSVISVVRSVAGPSWVPSHMCFTSPYRPPEAVHQEFPDTRILVGQPHASVTVERASLAQPTFDPFATARAAPASSMSKHEDDAPSNGWEFVDLLRALVQPYLCEGRHDVAFAAEMAGTSTRTLQRRLEVCGSSYSQVLQEARFRLALAHLADPAFKVIDIAMMAGYESPQHFTRAFRRFTGFTPTDYRRLFLGTEASVKRSPVPRGPDDPKT